MCEDVIDKCLCKKSLVGQGSPCRVAAEELEEGENPCLCYKCLGRAFCGQVKSSQVNLT